MCSESGLGLLWLAVLLVGCSIKEDRAACPCLLTLEMERLPVTPVFLDVRGDGFSRMEAVHADTVFVLPVPKGEVSVSVTGGALPGADGAVRIHEGEEAPPLYLFHAALDADVERMTVPVHLRKQFCTLELAFSGPSGYGPPFEVEVEGTVDGWLRDGSPSAGGFRRRVLPGEDGRAVLRLPRQEDDSLLMHIVFSDRIVRTFALGTYIAASGYDWSAPDLADLTLRVDLSITAVTFSIDLWSVTEEIDIWI